MKNRCFFTGHRDLRSDFSEEQAYRTIKTLYCECGVDTFLCGGAVGFDMIMGELVLKLKKECGDVKLWLYLPCIDQDARWGNEDKARRKRLIENADYIDCPQIPYNSTVMKTRNYKMVDACAYGVSYFNGKMISGTAQTLRYAKRKGRILFNLAKQGTDVIDIL